MRSHGAFCLSRVCTQKTFNPSRNGRWKEEGGGRTAPITFVWLQLEAWNFAQSIFNTLGFEWCKYIPCDDHGLKRRDNHGLKTGLHFFSFQKVNKQNKHLHGKFFNKKLSQIAAVWYYGLFTKIENIKNYLEDMTKYFWSDCYIYMKIEENVTKG